MSDAFDLIVDVEIRESSDYPDVLEVMLPSEFDILSTAWYKGVLELRYFTNRRRMGKESLRFVKAFLAGHFLSPTDACNIDRHLGTFHNQGETHDYFLMSEGYSDPDWESE